MSDYELMLLGEPVLSGPEGTVRISAARGQALIWYLAAQPHRTFTRTHLVSLLWENMGESRGRNTLSTNLTRLRHELPLWPLRTMGDSLGWDPDAPVRVDAQRFQELVNAARGADRNPDHRSDADATQWLIQAVSLWRGDFLAGFHLPGSDLYQQWLDHERERWQQQMLQALSDLVAIHEQSGRWREVLAHAQRALTIDPLQERLHRSVMTAHYQLGDRAAALAHFLRCRKTLQAELGVEPDAETLALREAIAQGTLVREGTEDEFNPIGPVGPAAAGFDPVGPAMARADEHRRREHRHWGHRPVGGHLGLPDLPLVGRAAELARLEASLGLDAAGEPRVVMLQGEAGIGKTRLVQELIRHLDANPGQEQPPRTLLVGRCHESTASLPYAPVAEAFQPLVHRVLHGELGLSQAWIGALIPLFPELAELTDFRPAETDIDEGGRQRLLFEGLIHLLTMLPGPTLLILEDVHWLDQHSRMLLAYLVRHQAAAGTRLLLTAREGEIGEALQRLLRQLDREGRLTRQRLGPLPPEAITSLVSTILGREDFVLAQRLHRETQGHALFAVDLLRSLRDDPQQGAEPMALGQIPLPSSIESLVENRMERLPPEARELLSTAAIFPVSASFPHLVQITGLSETAALQGLEVLIRTGILREADSVHLPGLFDKAFAPAVELRFAHDLVRRTVAARLSLARKQYLHRRAYEVLAAQVEQGPEGREPVLAATPWSLAGALAHHAVAGALWEEGVKWSERAAGAALKASFHSVEIEFLQQALICLDHLPATPDRRRKAIDFRLRLNYSYFYTQPKQMQAVLERAMADAAALGDEVRLARAQVAQSPGLLAQGRYQENVDRLEPILYIGRDTGSEVLLAGCLRGLGVGLMMTGAYGRAKAVLAEAAELDSRVGNPLKTYVDRSCLALTHAVQGEFDEAAAVFRELMAPTSEGADPPSEAMALAMMALGELVRGHWHEARKAARKAIDLAQETDHPFQEYLALLGLGPALFYLGDTAPGFQTAAHAVALARQVPTQMFLSLLHTWLAEMHLSQGDVAPARQEAGTAFMMGRREGARYVVARAMKAFGQIAAHTGRPAAARRHLERALARFDALGARPEVARCHAALATCTPKEQAAAHRRQAATLFETMGMEWDLQRLEAEQPTVKPPGVDRRRR